MLFVVLPVDQVYEAAPEADRVPLCPLQIVRDVAVKTGIAITVMPEVAVDAGHPFAGGIVLVTIYVPGLLVERSTSPVIAFIVNPGVDENTPAILPVTRAGIGFTPPAQKEEEE